MIQWQKFFKEVFNEPKPKVNEPNLNSKKCFVKVTPNILKNENTQEFEFFFLSCHKPCL